MGTILNNHCLVVAVLLSTTLTITSAFTRPMPFPLCNSHGLSRSIRIQLQPLHMISEEEKDYISPMRNRPQPKGGDVAYTNENIIRQNTHFNNIRKAGGSDCILDIYTRDPSTSGSSTRFWYVGKVARCTGTVSKEAAVSRQFNLLEEHACRIRPIELGRCFGKLEMFAAPGDTELRMSENDPTIRLEKMPRSWEGSKDVPLLEIGLNLDIVTNQGAGFFITRNEDGVVPPDMIGK